MYEALPALDNVTTSGCVLSLSLLVDELPPGYPRLAAFLDSSDDFMIFPKFGYIQARLLLQRQAQLVGLEEGLNYPLRTKSAELCELMSRSFAGKQISRSNIKLHAQIWLLNNVVPYLRNLLAFEVSILSASLTSIKFPAKDSRNPSQSDMLHQCVHRCESKLHTLKACIISAHGQLNQALSSLHSLSKDGSPLTEGETKELKANCDELRALISHVETGYSEALDLVQLHKSNVISDLQIELTRLQIRESRQAMDQANTVAKLTVLAFIFIPVSSISGVFGMNVPEIMHNARLWMFGVISGAVVAATLVLAFLGTIISYFRCWLESRDFSRLRAKNTGFRRPVHAVLYGICSLWEYFVALGVWLTYYKTKGEQLRRKDHEDTMSRIEKKRKKREGVYQPWSR